MKKWLIAGIAVLMLALPINTLAADYWSGDFESFATGAVTDGVENKRVTVTPAVVATPSEIPQTLEQKTLVPGKSASYYTATIPSLIYTAADGIRYVCPDCNSVGTVSSLNLYGYTYKGATHYTGWYGVVNCPVCGSKAKWYPSQSDAKKSVVYNETVARTNGDGAFLGVLGESNTVMGPYSHNLEIYHQDSNGRVVVATETNPFVWTTDPGIAYDGANDWPVMAPDSQSYTNGLATFKSTTPGNYSFSLGNDSTGAPVVAHLTDSEKAGGSPYGALGRKTVVDYLEINVKNHNARKTGFGYHETYAYHDYINVGAWVLNSAIMPCSHGSGTGGGATDSMIFISNGLAYLNKGYCGRDYGHLRGAIPVCADCGQRIDTIVYATTRTLASINRIKNNSEYVYFCMYQTPTLPINKTALGSYPYVTNHVEQWAPLKHICKASSPNQYRVQYMTNIGSLKTYSGKNAVLLSGTDGELRSGYFYNTPGGAQVWYKPAYIYKENLKTDPWQSHIAYDYIAGDASEFGWKVTGYTFGGWYADAAGTRRITKWYDPASPSGTLCNDAALLNGNDHDNRVIPLYAKWNQCNGYLYLLDEDGCYFGPDVNINNTYSGKTRYATVPVYENVEVKKPASKYWTVNYNPNNGAFPASGLTSDNTRAERPFSTWTPYGTFHGSLDWSTGKYIYTNTTPTNGIEDFLKASYGLNSVELPSVKRVGYELVGWSTVDGDEIHVVGLPGEPFTPTYDNQTLYAIWKRIDFTLNSFDDYTSNGGVGAVDLEWFYGNKDQNTQFAGAFRVFQSVRNEGGAEKGYHPWANNYPTPNFIGNLSAFVDSQNRGIQCTSINKRLSPVNDGVSTLSTGGVDKTIYASQTWSAPATGYYNVTLYGANGGNASAINGTTGALTGGTYSGGNGGYVTLKVFLQKGQTLRADAIAGGVAKPVTKSGKSYSSASGGQGIALYIDGTYVAVAGGGGGAGNSQNGAAAYNYCGAGGVSAITTGNGTGGNGSSTSAGGGGGYTGGGAGSASQITISTATNHNIHDVVRSVDTSAGGGTCQNGHSAAEDGGGIELHVIYCDADTSCPIYAANADGVNVTYPATKPWYYKCKKCGSTWFHGLYDTYENCCVSVLPTVGNSNKWIHVHGSTSYGAKTNGGGGGTNAWKLGYVNASNGIDGGFVSYVNSGSTSNATAKIVITGSPDNSDYYIGHTRDDVLSKDWAEPGTPSKITSAENIETKKYYVSWTLPDDRGTTYGFQAYAMKLTDVGTESGGIWSNVCENTLTVGIGGYYKIINNTQSFTINSSNISSCTKVTDWPGKNYATGDWTEYQGTTTKQYLHVAYFDKNGNIGGTYTYTIPNYYNPVPDHCAILAAPTIEVTNTSEPQVYHDTTGDIYYVNPASTLSNGKLGGIKLKETGKCDWYLEGVGMINGLEMKVGGNNSTYHGPKLTIPVKAYSDISKLGESYDERLAYVGDRSVNLSNRRAITWENRYVPSSETPTAVYAYEETTCLKCGAHVEKAGNFKKIAADRTPPSITIGTTVFSDANNTDSTLDLGTVDTPIVITVKTDDNGSGVGTYDLGNGSSVTTVSTDAVRKTTYTTNLSYGSGEAVEGPYEWIITVTDNVGNKRTVHVVLNYDKCPPIIRDDSPVDSNNEVGKTPDDSWREYDPDNDGEIPGVPNTAKWEYDWIAYDRLLSYYAYDNISGIKSFELYSSNSSWIKGDLLERGTPEGDGMRIAYTVTTEGRTYYLLEATDGVGRTTTVRLTVRVDKSAPEITHDPDDEDNFYKKSLASLTPAQATAALSDAGSAVMFTKITAYVSDTNSGDDYTATSDSSGLRRVVLKVWEVGNSSNTRSYLMAPAGLAAYTQEGICPFMAPSDSYAHPYQQRLLVSSFSVDVNFFADFADAAELEYSIVAYDNVGNISAVCEGKRFANFDIKAVDYALEVDDRTHDYSLSTDFNVPTSGGISNVGYYKTGEFGYIEVWTIGKVESLRFDFGVVGDEADAEIASEALAPKYKLNRVVDAPLPQYNVPATGVVEVSPGVYGVIDMPLGYARHYVYKGMPLGAEETDGWLGDGTNIRIPPNYQLTPKTDANGRISKDAHGNTEYEWEYKIARVYAEKTRSDGSYAEVYDNVYYVIWDGAGDDLHYRITHETPGTETHTGE